PPAAAPGGDAVQAVSLMAGSAATTGSGTRPAVLVGFADALAAPEVVFSLRDAGFDVLAFARHGAPAPMVARLPIAPPLTLPPPETDAEAAIAALRETARRTAPAAVLPLDDAALWLVDRAFGPAAGETSGPPVAGAIGAPAGIALDTTR